MAKSVIGKAFAKEPVDDATEGMDPSEDSTGSDADAEVLAMKAFSKAASPEAKASALKDFLRACGALGYEDEGSDEDSGMGGLGSLPAGF